MTHKRLMMTMTVMALTAGGVALADGDGAPPHHHRPPEEAFTACAGRSEGAACTVTFHEQAHEGSCRQAPADSEDAGKLVCVPPHPPGPPPHEQSSQP